MSSTQSSPLGSILPTGLFPTYRYAFHSPPAPHSGSTLSHRPQSARYTRARTYSRFAPSR
ncbi:MAG: hypothetical protein P4L33_07660 [Capsulimonadaceae bacterium]|nr:hypothetical protein [Capsulimonadaceae bacterium]